MPERAEGAPPRSVVDVEVVDVGEVHQQAVRAPAAVLEVDLLESFGHDVLELLLGGSGGMCDRALRSTACLGYVAERVTPNRRPNACRTWSSSLW